MEWLASYGYLLIAAAMVVGSWVNYRQRRGRR